MTDAIGHEVQVGDYVTAVWAYGYVNLFKVIGIKENHRLNDFDKCSPAFKLKRLQNKGNPVFKKPYQVTWVDPVYVTTFFLKKV